MTATAPGTPGISSDIVASLLATLDPGEREHCAVYVDEALRPAGAPSPEGLSPQPWPCWLAFVDLRPGANWMHACRYVFIRADDGSLHVVAGERPPSFGPLPASWRQVWCSPDVAQWQLLPTRPAAG